MSRLRFCSVMWALTTSGLLFDRGGVLAYVGAAAAIIWAVLAVSEAWEDQE